MEYYVESDNGGKFIIMMIANCFTTLTAFFLTFCVLFFFFLFFSFPFFFYFIFILFFLFNDIYVLVQRSAVIIQPVGQQKEDTNQCLVVGDGKRSHSKTRFFTPQGSALGRHQDVGGLDRRSAGLDCVAADFHLTGRESSGGQVLLATGSSE